MVYSKIWFLPSKSKDSYFKSKASVSHSASNGKYYHASGLNQNGIKKNIADLGGNVWEWTNEIFAKDYHVDRGGSAGEISSVSYRSAGEANYYLGFRVVLYIQ